MPGQTLADAGYAPYPHANGEPDWRELQFLVDMYQQGIHRRHELVGLFSPKFATKTLLTSRDVFSFVDSHPGGEIYTFIAHPQMPYMMYNVWNNGEDIHPGITGAAQALLNAVGLPYDLESIGRHSPDIWCMCNYWIGSTRFWNEYVGEVLLPIAEFVRNNPDSPIVRRVLSLESPHERTPFLPFIIERLFTTFLESRPDWRARVRQLVVWDTPRCLAFERDIMEAMKDRVDRADAEGNFPPELLATMYLLRRLRRRFQMAHYATHNYPDSDRPLSKKWISSILADVDSWPIVKL